MTPRLRGAFGALVATQAVHSAEEYAGRLWESFPPARFVSSLVSSDLERGFVIANVALIAFGVWCLLRPVRRRWPSAVPLAWAWVGIELVNGIGHPLWTLAQGRYTPGVATAPVLFLLAVALGSRLLRLPDATRPDGTSAPYVPGVARDRSTPRADCLSRTGPPDR